MGYRIYSVYPALILLYCAASAQATLQQLSFLLGTNGARQFSTGDVRKAWQGAATSLHKVQQCTILTCLSAMNVLRLSVNTNEVSGARVIVMCCHQIPMVLFVPAGWTVIPCRHHQL